MPTPEYEALIALGGASLADGEKWCIYHPDGQPLVETASERFDFPVIVLCDALDTDWDILQEQGFYIGKLTVKSY